MASKQKSSKGHMKHLMLSDNWAEPYLLDELAVDRKKVSEISSWLSDHRKKCGILLLTGSTGCGKTAVVKCVARSLGFEVREWVTPLDRDFQNGVESGVFQNQTEKFEDYLYSCSRYANLFVKSSNAASVLLVEDYPNIFLMKPEVFHDILGKYRAAAHAPIIFICSNVADKSLNMEFELFPLNVQRQYGISHIMLNPVTKKNMMQALKRMCAYLQSMSPGYKIPVQDVLNEICDSANGDVRYAMLSLQMKPQEDVAAMFDLAGKRAPNKKRANPQKRTQEEEIIASCGKDDRVGILHAVGRVLYPKWQNEGEKPYSSSVKRKRKEDQQLLDASIASAEWVHDPSTIADSYLSSASNFLLLVQENYLKTFSTIESVSAASLSLSNADVAINCEGVEASHEINFNAALRGVMCQNKVPHRAFNQVRSSRWYEICKTQKKLSSLTENLFPLYPVSHTVLMADVLPYMFYTCAKSLSSDQCKFVQAVASMESLTTFCESFRSFKEPSKSQHLDKATFIIDPKQQNNQEQDDELHISEDESDEEVDKGTPNSKASQAPMDQDEDFDEGAENLSLLEAAIEEEEQLEIDYNALLNDSEDDDILLSQF